MVEAWTRCPALKFVWVGDGKNRAIYERQLDEMGIRSRVILTGLVAPERVAPLLAGMDFVIHASQWEGLPRVAVQASFMERPVISFAIDGAPEVVIPEKTGILVPLNHIDALSRAIVTMAQDAELRRNLGRAARELCRARFDHRTMVDAIEQIYTSLLKL
jgi:glycosyltransferase involved in cell wall biosynthesis